MNLVSLVPAGMADHDYAGFVATDSAGEELFIKVLGREERSADLLVRLWRFVAFRGIQDEVSLVPRQRQVEHEALMAVLAAQAGVRTPHVKLAAQGSQGEAFPSRSVWSAAPSTNCPPRSWTTRCYAGCGTKSPSCIKHTSPTATCAGTASSSTHVGGLGCSS